MRNHCAIFGLAALLALVTSTPPRAQDQTEGHFRVERPARLSPPVAQSIYENAADDLALGYGLSDYLPARNYRRWERFNTFPYLSATHGNRYVNNFANEQAADYGKLAPGEKMPVGAVLAKDSFTVTRERRVFAAALFIMEKLEPARNPDTGDWRYVMVLPDGSVFADTLGPTREQAEFCHACHQAVANRDYLFFIPPAYRR